MGNSSASNLLTLEYFQTFFNANLIINETAATFSISLAVGHSPALSYFKVSLNELLTIHYSLLVDDHIYRRVKVCSLINYDRRVFVIIKFNKLIHSKVRSDVFLASILVLLKSILDISKKQ